MQPATNRQTATGNPAAARAPSLPHRFGMKLSCDPFVLGFDSHCPQAKVHQKALLAAGRVEGPTDPRLPTLRGLLRAGCHPDALKAFLLEQVRWLLSHQLNSV